MDVFGAEGRHAAGLVRDTAGLATLAGSKCAGMHPDALEQAAPVCAKAARRGIWNWLRPCSATPPPPGSGGSAGTKGDFMIEKAMEDARALQSAGTPRAATGCLPATGARVTRGHSDGFAFHRRGTGLPRGGPRFRAGQAAGRHPQQGAQPPARGKGRLRPLAPHPAGPRLGRSHLAHAMGRYRLDRAAAPDL
ncbi:hypothetical protein D3C81_1425050 [compost metagenome]